MYILNVESLKMQDHSINLAVVSVTSCLFQDKVAFELLSATIPMAAYLVLIHQV